MFIDFFFLNKKKVYTSKVKLLTWTSSSNNHVKFSVRPISKYYVMFVYFFFFLKWNTFIYISIFKKEQFLKYFIVNN